MRDPLKSPLRIGKNLPREPFECVVIEETQNPLVWMVETPEGRVLVRVTGDQRVKVGDRLYVVPDNLNPVQLFVLTHYDAVLGPA